jgi:hypothetical protein
MRTRALATIAVALAMVAALSTTRIAAAQGSSPIPTGGGSARQAVDNYDTRVRTTVTTWTLAWLGVAPREALTVSVSNAAWSRLWNTLLSRSAALMPAPRHR